MNPKTLTVERPTQMIHGYVPVVEIPTSDWGMCEVCKLHGDGHQLTDSKFIVLSTESRSTPPGAWIFTYEYDDNDGVSDVRTFVAAKVITTK